MVDELFGEKIDVINYTSDMETLIRDALMPGMLETVKINEEERLITCRVTNEEKPRVLGKG